MFQSDNCNPLHALRSFLSKSAKDIYAVAKRSSSISQPEKGFSHPNQDLRADHGEALLLQKLFSFVPEVHVNVNTFHYILDAWL